MLDAADIATESAFWAGVLGGAVDADDNWHTIMVDGKPALAVQLAPDHRAPEWPDGLPQQMHWTCGSPIPTTPTANCWSSVRACCRTAAGPGQPDDFRVYADPAGHPFCICWWNN